MAHRQNLLRSFAYQADLIVLPRPFPCSMGVSLFLEPLVVVVLLFGGAWINRVTDFSFSTQKCQWQGYDPFEEANAAFQSYRTNGEPAKNKKHCLSSLLLPSQESSWRERDIVCNVESAVQIQPSSKIDCSVDYFASFHSWLNAGIGLSYIG